MSLFTSYLGACRIDGTEPLNLGTHTLWRSIAKIQDYDDLPLKGAFLNCGGISTDPHLSLIKAKAEAMERYTMSFVSMPTHDKIDRNAYPQICEINSRKMLYDAPDLEQIQDELRWVTVTDMVNGQLMDVPEQWVNFRVAPSKYSHRVMPISSNGFSAHTEQTKTLVNGLLECVERDTVLRAWITLDQVAVLPEDQFPQDVADWYGYLREEGWILAVHALGNRYSIPTVWVMGYNSGLEQGKAMFGAKCALTYDEAVRGAMYEWLSNYGNEMPVSILEGYREQEVLTFFERISQKAEPLQYGDLYEMDGPQLAAWITSQGVSACLSAEYCLPEVQAEGFRVVRVIVPDMLYFSGRPTREILDLYNSNKNANPLLAEGIISIYD